VEFFHDVSHLNVRQLSETIKNDGMHILLNWDGYSNNGVRAMGLFPLMAAPLQVAHQVWLRSTIYTDLVVGSSLHHMRCTSSNLLIVLW
jgi:predicted O-linked N-acetylglucosamine transferase (SPINDLY family)